MKKQIYIGVGVAVVLIGIMVYFYFKGKSAGTVEQVPLPERFDVEGGGTIILTPTEGTDVRDMSRRLYEDMAGLNWGYHDLEVYTDLLALTDTLFVAVYNDFNTFYKEEIADGETLRNWLLDEDFSAWGQTEKDLVLARMDTFNLM